MMDMSEFDRIGQLLNTPELRIVALKGNITTLLNSNEAMIQREDWRELLAACAASNVVISQILIGMLEEEQ
jgi:hypothetical protein